MIHALSLIFVFEYKMHAQGIITLPILFATLNTTNRKLGSVQETNKAINKSIQRRSQYEDEQKYSITNVNINCPRTMIIRKYFPGE